MNLRINFLAFANIFRFGFKNAVIHGCFVHFPQLLSLKTTVAIGRRSKLSIGAMCECRKGCTIQVGTNGELLIGKNVFLNTNVSIACRDKIEIADGVTVGQNVVIIDHDHDKYKRGNIVTSPVFIGANTWIGANCVILKGAVIGENCIIGAGSIINKIIPNNSIVYDKRVKVIEEV